MLKQPQQGSLHRSCTRIVIPSVLLWCTAVGFLAKLIYLIGSLVNLGKSITAQAIEQMCNLAV